MKEKNFGEIKNKVRDQITEGHLEQAISTLLQYINENSDKRLNNRIRLASFDYEQTKDQDMAGIIKKELFLSHRKEIAEEVLAILDDVENGNYDGVVERLEKLGLLMGISLLLDAKAILKSPPLIDPRDGKVYKTVKLIGKVWMAENLNYDIGEGCWIYDNKSDNGKKYGRLYTWKAAIKACPPGWRVPEDEEWETLAQEFGGYWDSRESIDSGRQAYSALIKGGSSGFSALLGGCRDYYDSDFNDLGHCGTYWTATKYSSDCALTNEFDRGSGKLYRIINPRAWGYSCRCVQD